MIEASVMAAIPQRRELPKNLLEALRVFCHAAQTQSMSGAAKRLGLSQPSVSLMIKRLEAGLGTPLFERHGPRIELSAEGRTLQELASPLVEGMDVLPQLFAERCGEAVSGTLRVAAGESTILYILPDIVKRFADAYPGIRFILNNVTGRDGLALLRSNDVDLAIGSMLEVPEDISYYPLFTYDPMLITCKGHPLAARGEALRLQDISPYGLILPPRHLSTWRMVDLVFRQHGASYSVALEAGGWEVVKEYVARGLGVSIVTSICLGRAEGLASVRLDRYFPKRSYGLVLRKGQRMTPAAMRFIEILAPEFFAGRQV